jgi:hypothetical protein
MSTSDLPAALAARAGRARAVTVEDELAAGPAAAEDEDDRALVAAADDEGGVYSQSIESRFRYLTDLTLPTQNG